LLVVRRAITGVTGTGPVAALIARITAPRRIIVPFAPVHFVAAAVAAAAAEPIEEAHDAAATRAEKQSIETAAIASTGPTSARRLATAAYFAAAAASTAAAASITATARAGAATTRFAAARGARAFANRNAAWPAAVPCLPGKLGAATAVAAAARFAATTNL
jgi:hypothetical protein